MKIATSVHEVGFRQTNLVGVESAGVPDTEELADGVQIVRLPGSDRHGNLGWLQRFLFWQLRVYLRYRRLDVSVVAAHNLWVLPMCWLLSRATGAALVYNAHELETETIRLTGIKQRVAKVIESRLIGGCSIVSVVNEPIADWYECAYPIPRPIVVGNVPVDNPVPVRLREQLGVADSELLYVHTGHLADGRNIPVILASFARCDHHVVFLGEGPHSSQVLAASAEHSNIHWLPPVEPDEIVSHLRDADVGLCLIETHLDLSDHLSSPNKLLEALAAGIPALCSDLVEARRLMGPLAEDWILGDPVKELSSALARITKSDVGAFRDAWPGLPPWHEEVTPLVEAYQRLVAGAPS